MNIKLFAIIFVCVGILTDTGWSIIRKSVVTDENGILASPTNFTIQQSNVSGLISNLNTKLSTNGNGSALTNLSASNIFGVVALASNVSGTIAISNGGSGATSANAARINLGLGWSALTNTNASTSLLGFTTNGQVIANTGTNVLTFTNGIRIGLNPTNVPASGQVVMQQAATNVASEITMWSADQTTSASLFFKKQNLQTNWSIATWGNNITIDLNNEHNLRNGSQPASYWSIENNFDQSSAAPQYGDSIAETYFTAVASNSFNAIRGWAIIANQKNPNNGLITHSYPTVIISTPSKRIYTNNNANFWDEFYAFKVIDDSSIDAYGAMFLNRSQSNSASISTDWALQGQFSSDIFRIKKSVGKIEFFHNPDGFTAMSSTTNGVLIGGSNNSNASSRVHLGGNTRIDGAISFDNTTNAATTRTNLGLGNGITTNISSGTLQFSNGILVGHTP